MQARNNRSRLPPTHYWSNSSSNSTETTYSWTNANRNLESSNQFATNTSVLEVKSIAKDPKISQPFKRVFNPDKDHQEWLDMKKHPGKGNWPKELPKLILFWKSIYPDLDEEELADLKESPHYNPRTCIHRDKMDDGDFHKSQAEPSTAGEYDPNWHLREISPNFAILDREFQDKRAADLAILLQYLNTMELAERDNATDMELPKRDDATDMELPKRDDATDMELPKRDNATDMELPKLDQDTDIELPKLDDATDMELHELDDAIDMELAKLDDATDMELAKLDDAIDMELPELDQSACMELSELDQDTDMDFQNTDMELPELDDAIYMDLPELDDATDMDLPELDQGACMELPELDDVTDMELPELDQDIDMELPELDDDNVLDFQNTEINYDADEMALMARHSLLLQQYAEEDPIDDLIVDNTFVAAVIEQKIEIQTPRALDVQPRDNFGKFAKKTEEAKKTKKQPDTKKYVAAGNFLLNVRYEIPDAHRNVNSVPICFSEFVDTEEASANVIDYLQGCVQFGVLEKHRSLENLINQGKAIDFYFDISKKKCAAKKKPSASELYKKLAEALKLTNADNSNVTWFQKRRALAKIYDLLQLNRYGYRCSPTELLDIAPQIERARKLKLVKF